jgi:hypothetical protein
MNGTTLPESVSITSLVSSLHLIASMPGSVGTGTMDLSLTVYWRSGPIRVVAAQFPSVKNSQRMAEVGPASKATAVARATVLIWTTVEGGVRCVRCCGRGVGDRRQSRTATDVGQTCSL